MGDVKLPFPISTDDALEVSAVGEGIIGLRRLGILRAGDEWPYVLAINRVLGQWCFREVRDRGQEIDRTPSRLGDAARREFARIFGQAGTAYASIKARAFRFAERRGACMVSVGDPGAIVRGEDE